MSTPPPAAVTVVIDGLRVLSEANTASHGHWRTRHRRTRAQKDLVLGAMLRMDRSAWKACHRLRVTFQRVKGPRGRDMDDDNLVGAFKAVRDAVAHWAGVSDGDVWWDWRYDPEQVKGKEYGVRIRFEAVPVVEATLKREV